MKSNLGKSISCSLVAALLGTSSCSPALAASFQFSSTPKSPASAPGFAALAPQDQRDFARELHTFLDFSHAGTQQPQVQAEFESHLAHCLTDPVPPMQNLAAKAMLGLLHNPREFAPILARDVKTIPEIGPLAAQALSRFQAETLARPPSLPTLSALSALTPDSWNTYFDGMQIVSPDENLAITPKTVYDFEFSSQYDRLTRTREFGFFNNQIDQPSLTQLIRPLVERMPPGGRALDVGAGTGRLTHVLHDMGLKVVAMERSPAMLKLGMEKYPELNWLLADATKPFPFPDGTFDLVTSALMIHYAKDLSGLFREIARVLRPESRFVFSTVHPTYGMLLPAVGEYLRGGSAQVRPYFPENREDAWELLEQGQGAWMRYFRHIVEDISLALEKSGLQIERVREPRPAPAAKKDNPPAYDLTTRWPSWITIQAQRVNAAASRTSQTATRIYPATELSQILTRKPLASFSPPLSKLTKWAAITLLVLGMINHASTPNAPSGYRYTAPDNTPAQSGSHTVLSQISTQYPITFRAASWSKLTERQTTSLLVLDKINQTLTTSAPSGYRHTASENTPAQSESPEETPFFDLFFSQDLRHIQGCLLSTAKIIDPSLEYLNQTGGHRFKSFVQTILDIHEDMLPMASHTNGGNSFSELKPFLLGEETSYSGKESRYPDGDFLTIIGDKSTPWSEEQLQKLYRAYLRNPERFESDHPRAALSRVDYEHFQEMARAHAFYLQAQANSRYWREDPEQLYLRFNQEVELPVLLAREDKIEPHLQRPPEERTSSEMLRFNAQIPAVLAKIKSIYKKNSLVSGENQSARHS